LKFAQSTTTSKLNNSHERTTTRLFQLLFFSELDVKLIKFERKKTFVALKKPTFFFSQMINKFGFFVKEKELLFCRHR